MRQPSPMPRGDVRADLTELVYELLDAHVDTTELAADLGEPEWAAHLDYLRALQREARAMLAHLP